MLHARPHLPRLLLCLAQRAQQMSLFCLACHPCQVLVEAELPDGEPCSVLLQNAETVRLVGPAPGGSSSSLSLSSSSSSRKSSQAGANAASAAAAEDGFIWQQGGSGSSSSWRAISVSELVPGDQVYVLRQGGARHTGVAIEESITER